MSVTGKTHIGLVRANNQDALIYAPLEEHAVYAVVCDGMGGANGGNVASEIAAWVISSRVTENFRSSLPGSSVNYLLESAMAAANVEIFDRAMAEPEYSGMGTTAVAVVVCGRQAYISHVGDSRAYLIRDDTFEQITRDHSIVQEMIESGQLTEEQARTHPRKHFITRALGVDNTVQSDCDELQLRDGDRLLLCTDGLTNMVTVPDIKRIVQQKKQDSALVDDLIQAALDGGGADNVTAVIVGLD